jgi:outer membrane protein assembly factor BamB
MRQGNRPAHRTSRVRRGFGLVISGAVALTTLLAVPSTTLAAGGLTMTGFKPASGPIGTVVTVTGTGFASGDIVAFNGTPATSSTANKKGTKLKASVPAFATSGPITVTDAATGQTVGLPGTAFDVTAGLFASPNHVWAGGSLTVAGSALAPDQTAPIDVGKVLVGEAQTNANGDFSVGVVIPWNIPSGKTKLSVIASVGRFTFPIFIVGSWPSFHHDLSQSGVQPYEPTLTPKTVGGLGELWGDLADSVVYSSPAVANGTLYVGSDDQNVYALNVTNGTLDWRYTTGNAVQSSPAVANGVVYIGSEDGNVYALNASTGAVDWTYATGDSIQSSPQVSGGLLYIGSEDDNVYALNATTGALVWKYTTGDIVDSSPAVANGIVYIGSADGHLYALTATTGVLDWSASISGLGRSSPAVVGGRVYISSGDTNIYAVNATTGAIVWHYDTGQPNVSTPAVANGLVFVGSGEGDVYALDAATGATQWAFYAGGEVISSPAVADGVVYVGSYDDDLYALAASNGNELWSGKPGSTIGSSPAVANGMVFVGSSDGSISAYGL